MKPLSLPLLLCQCAILLVSFEGIVCEFFDFVIENFNMANIYSTIKAVGRYETGEGHFAFKKDGTAADVPDYILPFSDILHETARVEGSNERVVSFSVKGADSANFNIKFKSITKARLFVKHKELVLNYGLQWARIYSHWRPVIMAYEYLDDDDVGIKFVDNENYPNLDEHLYHLPYLFKRCEMNNAIKTRTPHTLFMRNQARFEDYMIQFKCDDDLSTFLKLFPDRIYDEHETVSYYFMPYPTKRNDQ